MRDFDDQTWIERIIWGMLDWLRPPLGYIFLPAAAIGVVALISGIGNDHNEDVAFGVVLIVVGLVPIGWAIWEEMDRVPRLPRFLMSIAAIPVVLALSVFFGGGMCAPPWSANC